MTAPPLPAIATDDALTVDWGTGTDADTSAYNETHYRTPPGIAINGIGRATHRAYGPPGTPSCDFTIPNTDGTYSPGGTLGLFVNRGPDVIYAQTWGTDVTADDPAVSADDPGVLADGMAEFRLFTGSIDTAPQKIDNPASVQIRAQGRAALLLETKPVIALQENILTSAAWRLVHIACGFTDDDLVIDDGDTTLLYFWASGDLSGSDLENLILGAEGVPACAFEDSSGRKHFEGRQYRQNATRSNTVQWNLFDGVIGTYNATADDPTVLADDPNVFADGPVSALLFHIVPAQWQSNPDETVKSVTATVNVRTPSAIPTKISDYGGPLILAANESRDIEHKSSDPFKNAISPLLGTDYSIGAGSLVSVTLLETSGTKVRVRYVAGAGGATVNGPTSSGPQLRATTLLATSTVPVTATVDTDLSAARFRPKDHALNLWPEITANQALDLANNFARRYQRPRDQMTVQMVNIDAEHLYAMLHMQISDRVRIRHTRAGINSAFFVESMSYGLTDGGGLMRMTLNVEKVTDDVAAQYGSARYGFDVYSGA